MGTGTGKSVVTQAKGEWDVGEGRGGKGRELMVQCS